MDIDYSSLHKILKDATRREVLQSLSNGPLTYTELMTQVKVSNTGKFNYHLKVLGDLIEKMSDGRYKLTERGQIAVQMLEKFPSKNVGTVAQPPVIGYHTHIWAEFRRKELVLLITDVTLANLAFYLFFFGVLFLRRPWPYGSISLDALAGIMLSAIFTVLAFVLHRKYIDEKERNKKLALEIKKE